MFPTPCSIPVPALCPTPKSLPDPSSDVLHLISPIPHSVLSCFLVLDPDIFPQLDGLKLKADNEFIYVFDVDTVPVPV
jgi:hypothetical protein